MSSPKVVFITGLSGTGKSTLVEYFLAHPLSNWQFHDFDRGELPIPDNQSDHLDWRRQQTSRWLDKALENFNERSVNTAVLGLSLYPEDTFALAAAKKIGRKNIYFSLIHTDPVVRQKRLIHRGTPQHWQGHKPWYDEFYGKLKEVEAPIFDTTEESLEITGNKIAVWLRSLK